MRGAPPPERVPVAGIEPAGGLEPGCTAPGRGAAPATRRWWAYLDNHRRACEPLTRAGGASAAQKECFTYGRALWYKRANECFTYYRHPWYFRPHG